MSRLRVTARAWGWRRHTCVDCGARFHYRIAVEAGCLAESLPNPNAQAVAESIAERRLLDALDLVPCPTCGVYQPEMLPRWRMLLQQLAFVIASLAAPQALVVAAMSFPAMENPSGFRAFLSDGDNGWLRAAPFGLALATWVGAILLQLALQFRGPNRDPARNLDIAREQIERKTLIVESEGAPPEMRFPIASTASRPSLAHCLRLAAVALGLALLMTPVIAPVVHAGMRSAFPSSGASEAILQPHVVEQLGWVGGIAGATILLLAATLLFFATDAAFRKRLPSSVIYGSPRSAIPRHAHFIETTVRASGWKRHVCVECGGGFRLRVSTEAAMRAATLESAHHLAQQRAVHQMRTHPRAMPCPLCGALQPEMLPRRQAQVITLVLAAIAAVALVPLSAIVMRQSVVKGNDLSLARLSTLWPELFSEGPALFAVAVVPVAIALYLWLRRRSPNCHRQVNRAAAQRHVEQGTLLAEHAPRPLPSIRTRWLRRLHAAALLLVLPAIASFVAPTVVRLQQGWVLNSFAVTSVVGPGDAARIRMGESFLAVDGHWVSELHATVQNWQELGLAGEKLTLECDQRPWQAEMPHSTPREVLVQPWGVVHLPDGPRLAGRTLVLNVRGVISYPATLQHTDFYETREQSVDDTLAVKLSAPGAAHSYAVLQAICLIAGACLLLLAAMLLGVLAYIDYFRPSRHELILDEEKPLQVA